MINGIRQNGHQKTKLVSHIDFSLSLQEFDSTYCKSVQLDHERK